MATQSSGAGVGSETLCEREKADKDETATLKIKLKKKEKETKKIQWTEDTVDNEGKNRQIYMKLMYGDKDKFTSMDLNICRTRKEEK